MSLLCFFAHHRCGSSWTNDMLKAVSHAAGWRHRVAHNTDMFGHDPGRFCRENRVELLTFSNAKSEYLQGLPPFSGLHLVRDPRDVLVSSYFSHRFSHPTNLWPELIEHRRELQALSEQEGLLRELDCRAEQFEDMRAWQYGAPNILEKKMEDVISDPAVQLAEIFTHWGRLAPDLGSTGSRTRAFCNRVAESLERRAGRYCKLPRWRMEQVSTSLLRQVATANNFNLKSGGRAQGEVDLHHHYRAGVPGDWRNYFFDELSRQFKARHSDLLIKLGYEKNADW